MSVAGPHSKSCRHSNTMPEMAMMVASWKNSLFLTRTPRDSVMPCTACIAALGAAGASKLLGDDAVHILRLLCGSVSAPTSHWCTNHASLHALKHRAHVAMERTICFKNAWCS